jgi:hypothetical protein
MLSIAAAREIRPPFEDEYGEPDTLPAQFVDPDSGYCRPYPHWKSGLTRQVIWVPTFILRFKATIPNDQSELSITLRGLSDEQIVILLNDGPFKSGQAAWRDMKKTDSEIDTMRSNSRRYQRVDRVSGLYVQLESSLYMFNTFVEGTRSGRICQNHSIATRSRVGIPLPRGVYVTGRK